MIDPGRIEAHLTEILAEAGCFLVSVKVDRNNSIVVHIDRDEGVSIDDCAKVSRSLEAKLDRNLEDFSLEVSSPGLDAPFMVREQYHKNMGRKVRVVVADGRVVEGLLREVSETGIGIEAFANREGAPAGETINLDFGEIKSARNIVSM